ncbi:MAG: hypothetical protein LBC02_14850 [Planctomycetaceae bacterium]|nr:hypothetical protein [Planctomycetaceae bacterium]
MARLCRYRIDAFEQERSGIFRIQLSRRRPHLFPKLISLDQQSRRKSKRTNYW